MSLKALILVGGYGTRLRPITFTIPKPVIEFCGRPFIYNQLDALAKVGVDQIIFALSHFSETIKSSVLQWVKNHLQKTGKLIDIIFSNEPKPLGTAGPLKYAENYLTKSNAFFVLNSDVICEYPLEAMLAKAKETNGNVMLVTPVSDPSKYGLVSFENLQNRVEKFIEKPKTYNSNDEHFINAGIYLLKPDILTLIPENVMVSIEKQIFPKVAQMKELFVVKNPSFWMDIGQPFDFLKGTHLLLESQKKKNMVFSDLKNVTGLEIGQDVIVGANCEIGKFCKLENCVIMSGSKIGDFSLIKNSIIAPGCSLGKRNFVLDTIFGELVQTQEDCFISNSKICPFKEISTHQTINESIM
jgi:mannose-1-phosphate guanylyltransferase